MEESARVRAVDDLDEEGSGGPLHRSRSVARRLGEMLGDTSRDVRFAVVRSLACIRCAGVEKTLAEMLRVRSDSVPELVLANAAAEALGFQHTKGARDVLMAVVSRDETPGPAREACLRALGACGGAKAVRFLCAYSEHSEWAVRMAAGYGLISAGHTAGAQILGRLAIDPAVPPEDRYAVRRAARTPPIRGNGSS